jgi:hypothetical protein
MNSTDTPIVPIISEAISSISRYPVAKRRKDMTPREYTVYKSDWDTFNRIWAYDYSVSTLNSINSILVPITSTGPTNVIKLNTNPYLYYKFQDNSERMSYTNGQNAHIEYYITYSGIAPIGRFDTIR